MHVSDDASLPSSRSALSGDTRGPPGAIPVASLPPEGAIGLTLEFVRKPRCSSESFENMPNLTREYFFSASLPDDRVAAYGSRLGDESYRVFLGMLV